MVTEADVEVTEESLVVAESVMVAESVVVAECVVVDESLVEVAVDERSDVLLLMVLDAVASTQLPSAKRASA